MRPFLKKLVSVIILAGLTIPILAEKSTEEARLIRKVFLDIRQVPPTPEELNWYLCYNAHPYQAAVNWITSQTKVNSLKEYLLSAEYKQTNPIKLDQQMRDLIIKYQAGNLNVSVERADKLLVQIAIACGEDNPTDVIDYLSLCLIARTTNVQEINSLLKVFRQQAKEEDGYLAVLRELKHHKDFEFN